MRKASLLFGTLLLAGCGLQVPGLPAGFTGWAGGGPSTVSMACGDWDFRYGSGMPAHPSCTASGIAFEWTGELDYLTTDVSTAAKDKAHAVIKLEALSGSPVFKASDGGSPAACRIMLEVRNDDMRHEDGRWWARLNGPALSAPGNYVMDVSIADLDQWSNVRGQVASTRANQFRAAMGKLGAVGITCGANSFGHGVSVEGGAVRVTITEVSVQ
jgi:hypothetical protein